MPFGGLYTGFAVSHKGKDELPLPPVKCCFPELCLLGGSFSGLSPQSEEGGASLEIDQEE